MMNPADYILTVTCKGASNLDGPQPASWLPFLAVLQKQFAFWLCSGLRSKHSPERCQSAGFGPSKSEAHLSIEREREYIVLMCSLLVCHFEMDLLDHQIEISS